MLAQATWRLVVGRAVLLLACFLTSCKPAPQERAASFHDIMVADVSPATRGQHVRNTAIVTYSDPEWHLLFGQDAGDGVYIAPPPGKDFKAGDQIEIHGLTTEPGKLLDQTQFSVLKKEGPLPEPEHLSRASEFTKFPSRFVETIGTVRWAGVRAGRAALEVYAGDHSFLAYVYPGTAEDLPRIGSTISISGVSAAEYDGNGQVRTLQLLTPSARFLKVIKSGPSDPFFVPVKTLDELSGTPAGSLVHVAGRLQNGAKGLSLSDGKRSVALVSREELHDSFAAVEVAAFWSGNTLEDAMVRPVGERVGQTGDIVRLSDLKRLSAEEAAKRRRVSVRAVVTFIDPYWHLLFVQDRTAAAFVNLSGLNVQLRAGDVVDVFGVSGSGDFAPVITDATVSFIGRGRLPVPLQLDLVHGELGDADSQWCTFRSVVHTAQVQDGHTVLKIGAGQTAIQVELPTLIKGDELVDKEISVTGALGILFNERRQAVGHQIFVPGPEFVVVTDKRTKPGRAATIASLRRYAPDADEHHSVTLSGTVVLKRSENVIYIQDKTAGIQVRTLEPVSVSDGDHVSVRGFILSGEYSPVLEDAVVEREFSALLPEPEKISAKSALEGPHDSEYVSMQGRLSAVRSAPNETVLVINDDGTFFEAIGPAADELNSLRVGSLVSVRGICRVIMDQTSVPFSIRGFNLMFDSPVSMSVLQPGPWWDSSKIQWALILIFSLAAAAVAWAALLRRQVSIKTFELQSSLQTQQKAMLFDAARNQVLESIVRNAPLPESMERLAVAIEQQIAGSLCIIATPPDGKSFVNGQPAPLLIAPGLAEDVQMAMLPIVSAVVVPSKGGDDAVQIKTTEDIENALLKVLRDAGLPFQEGEAMLVFSGAGSVAGLLVLFLKESTSPETEGGRQAALQSASQLISLAGDHWHMHDRLLHEARHDRLTGLPNRTVAEDRLEQALARAERRRSLFAVFCIDLDGFKAINDELGHDAGDELLCALAARLRVRTRHSDTIARIGGDEFLAIIEDCADHGAARAVAASLITAIGEPVLIEGRELSVSGSVGIAMYPADGKQAAQLRRNADQAMYRAKSQGGNQIAFWSEEEHPAKRAAKKSSTLQ